MASTFMERMASRIEPIGLLGTVESRVTVARMGTGVRLGAMTFALLFALLFFWFDEPLAAAASVVLALAYLSAWVFLAATGNLRWSSAVVMPAATLVIIFIHVVLGGYAYSGAYLMWLTAILIAASMVASRRAVAVVAVVFCLVAIGFGFAEQALQEGREPPDATLSTILFVVVFVGTVVLVAPLLLSLHTRLTAERQRAEALLLNVLPAAVEAELKETGTTKAQHFDAVSVLFADVVGFTPLSATHEPEEMVDQLNEVFTHFDLLVERCGVEKIRTIGDSYMVAAGVPVPRHDHAEVLCTLALDMLAYAETCPFSFRIGINSGPVVAGVIGTRKFQYDIWGDTVNTASRMESHGEPDSVQISDATYQLVKDRFVATSRGEVQVKGKGAVTTWWLEAEADLVGADSG